MAGTCCGAPALPLTQNAKHLSELLAYFLTGFLVRRENTVVSSLCIIIANSSVKEKVIFYQMSGFCIL